jgi:hypothetical protein
MISVEARLERAQKLARTNHTEKESNAKKLRESLKSKDSLKAKYNNAKNSLDVAMTKLSKLKKQNASLEKNSKGTECKYRGAAEQQERARCPSTAN